MCLVRALLAMSLAVLVLPFAATTVAASASARVASSGEAAETPDQILADSVKAALAARSVRIVARVVSGGTSLSFNLSLLAGSGGKGEVTQSGLSFSLVRIGGEAYFDASPAFWRHYAGTLAATLLEGHWIEASATRGDLASFTPLTDLAAFIKQVLGSHGVLKLGAPSRVGNRSAIALTDTTKGGTLYIAASGPPYPLKITPPKGQEGSVSFENWNGSVTLTRPAHAIPYSEFIHHG